MRRKSFDDLHKLWCVRLPARDVGRRARAARLSPLPPRFVLLKERNMLVSERAGARTLREKFLNPKRISKVRKSMARIKCVLTERAIENWEVSGAGPEELAAAKAVINGL